MSEEILELNHIDYSQPKIVNPSKITEKLDIPINPNRYDECVGGEEIPILFESLDKPCCYIDGSRSTLSLQLQVNMPVPVLDTDPVFYQFDINRRYDSGASIINLFQEVLHKTSNSQILYRENYLNQMQTFRNYRISPEHRQNLTMVGSSPSEISYQSPTYPLYPINKIISFDIPLSLLAPFWNTASPIPAEILNKSLLLLKVANSSFIKAFDKNNTIQPVPADTTFSFMNMSLRLHRTQLYDNIETAIKSSQLEFPYLSNFNFIYQPIAESFVVPINLQASKVSYVGIKFFRRVNNQYSSTIASADVYELTGGNGDENSLGGMNFQLKVGEMFLPKFKIDTATQAYIETCDALDKTPYKNTESPDPLMTINQLESGTIPYNNYCFNRVNGDTTYISGDSTGCFLFAISLQKYGGVSGLSTNANRLLALHVDGLKNYPDYEAYIQVQYMSNVSITGGDVSVTENNIIVSK